MQPLVSICIPTYNRAGCLNRTIESIVSQAEFQNGEVEIVVSDNASTDNTKEVCEKYLRYDNFYYCRNEENVRDRNYSIVLSEAHGLLRKLNNDTFILNDGSLKKLCNLVNQYKEEQPFIFLINEKNSIKEMNFHDFVLDVSYRITWIASFTIWENECEGIAMDTKGCELLLWQVRKAFELAYKKNSAVVYYQKIGNSIIPPKKNISYGLFQVFYCNYFELLSPYIDNHAIDGDDIEKLEKDLLFDFFPLWIISFELNNTDMCYSEEENLKTAVWNQYKDKPYFQEFEKTYKRKLQKTKMIIRVKRILGK